MKKQIIASILVTLLLITFSGIAIASDNSAGELTRVNYRVYINDKEVISEIGFYERNSILYASMRCVAESMGAQVAWDELNKQIIYSLDSSTLIMMIDSTIYTYDGQERQMPEPPSIFNNRILVPIQVVADLFDCNLKVDKGTATNTLIITDFVNQFEKYKMPDKINLNDGSNKDAKVKWNPSKVDTSKKGIFIYTGTVKGSNELVTLKLIVGKVVDFPDENLEQFIKQTINKPSGDIYDFEVEPITSLEAVYLNIADVRGLENLANLKYLALRGNKISDISELSGLSQLSELDLSHNQLIDISTISKLNKLEYLNLFNNNITDLEPLSKLTNLRTLYLGDNEIDDVSALSSLSSLRTLGLEINPINDISPLSGLTNLERLHLSRIESEHFEVISNFTRLQMLELHSNNISDISILSNLTNCQVLGLWGNQIDDISPLSALSQLHTLDVGNNQLKDISWLSGLTNLVWLMAGNNEISDISALSSLYKLSTLSIGDNQIGDISPLFTLRKLTYLGKQNNPISDSDIQRFRDLFPNCTIYSEEI